MEFDLQTFYEQLKESCVQVNRIRISPYYVCDILRDSKGTIFHIYLDVYRDLKVDHINISG